MNFIPKNCILIIILSLAVFSLSAQTYTRKTGERTEDFINRIKPDRKGLIHTLIEDRWNNPEKEVIAAFWKANIPESDQTSDTNVSSILSKLYVPIGENHYQMITIDSIPGSPSDMSLISVFFYDRDIDGKRELVAIYSNQYKCSQMTETIYSAKIYDDIDYANLPDELPVLEIIKDDIHSDNDTIECTEPEFTRIEKLRHYMENVPFSIPDSLAGKYVSDGCFLEIDIIKDKGEYRYIMQTGEKKYNGSIRFSSESEMGEQRLWVILQDFQWAEYKGNLMDVEDPDEVPSLDMWGLDLYYDKGELTFQNYGNAMNYYVKMNECDQKYIRLIKEK